jgi:hypothetical protein
VFDGLPKYQLDQLAKVWDATAKAMHWRECALHEMGRAVAAGCTPEHLAAVTGFDVEVVKQLFPRAAAGVQRTAPHDPHAPGQERFNR